MAVDITGLNTRTTTSFIFDAKRACITIFEPSFIRFLLVVNLTRGQNIFNVNEVQFSGEQVGKTLNIKYDVKSMQGDDMLVIFEANSTIESTLNELLKEFRKSNDILQILADTIR